jgi:riboflavin synthase
MYTGIVQALLPINSLKRKTGLMTFGIKFPDPLLVDLQTGASVAVNGTCFTVTHIVENEVFFDAIAATLDISNTSELEEGLLVNIERSAHAGAEVGGHILSGHVIDVAKVSKVVDSENNRKITLTGHKDWMKYVFNKGFLALNGASLTIAEVDGDHFSINLIPETLERTNFSLMKVGDAVNVELDQQTQVIVDTVERVMAERYT